MTSQEFAEKMKAIEDKHDGDWEVIHSQGDDLMCILLRELGYSDGIDVYETWVRWHA